MVRIEKRVQKFLKKERLAQMLSQGQLAEIAGVTQAYVAYMETKNCNPSLRVLNDILSALGYELQIEEK